MNLNNKNKHRILVFIKVPPPVTGVTEMNSYVANGALLNNIFNIRSIKISYSNTVDDIGTNLFRKSFLLPKIFFLLLKELIIYRPRLVYFQISTNGAAFFRDSLFVLLIKLFQIKILFHLHGKGISQLADKVLVKKLISFVFRNEYIICLSELVKDDIKSVYQESPYIVHNGIPIIEESNIANALNSKNEVTILYLSNFSKQKGILILIEALGILLDKNIPFSVSLVGRKSDYSKSDIESLIKKKGLSNNVKVLVDLYDNDKFRIFKQADIFVFPTQFEAFGNVVLEAMQFSLPVVASNEGSLPNIVDDGKTGYLFSKKDPVSLSAKIELLLKNASLRREFGEAGRKKFYNNFTLNIFERNMQKVFNSIFEREKK